MTFQIIDSQTERTTAITNLLITIQSIIGAMLLLWGGSADMEKAMVWAWAFGLMGIATFLGAIVHGLQLSPTAHQQLWRLIALSLGLALSLFLVGACYDLWGEAMPWWVLPLAIGIAVSFFGLSLVSPSVFMLFIIYELFILLIALAGYGWLALFDLLPGAWWMVAGLLCTIFASFIQTQHHLSLTIRWQFDHNGLFHLIQWFANNLVLIGLLIGLHP